MKDTQVIFCSNPRACAVDIESEFDQPFVCWPNGVAEVPFPAHDKVLVLAPSAALHILLSQHPRDTVEVRKAVNAMLESMGIEVCEKEAVRLTCAVCAELRIMIHPLDAPEPVDEWSPGVIECSCCDTWQKLFWIRQDVLLN